MKQAQIIFRLLFPTDQYPPKAVHPTMRPLHNPPPSLESDFSLDSLCLFSSGLDMRGVAELLRQVAHLVVIVALIQTKILQPLFRRPGPLYRNALKRLLYHLHVMPVGAFNSYADRDALRLTEQAALHAAFAAVGGVSPGFFPRRAEPLSSRRPSTAIPSRFPAGHRIPPVPSSTVCGKRRPQPSIGTTGGRSSWRRCPLRKARSIDSRYAERRRCRPLLCADWSADDGNPRGAVCSAEGEAQSSPTVHPVCATCRLLLSPSVVSCDCAFLLLFSLSSFSPMHKKNMSHIGVIVNFNQANSTY